MKIGNNQILIVLLTVGLFLVSVYTFSAKATLTPGEAGGYMVLEDQKASDTGWKSFTTVALLPSDDCDGVVTSCSYNFPEATNAKEDINGDGIIDYTDLYFVLNSFGCTNANPTCWSESIKKEDCYFTYSGRTFKDPSGDCHITQADDVQAVLDQFGKTNTKVTDPSCDLDSICRADLNKDGKVDMYDVALISANVGRWADVFVNYGYIKKGNSDVNSDGKISMDDIVEVAGHLGITASEQKCTTSSMTALGNRQYQVTASGKGLYFVSLSYRCR